MKFKFPFFILCGFTLIGLMTNSCKKNNQDYIQTLFTGGYWQLSNMQVTYYTGANTDSTLSQDTSCNLNQVFTFNTDNTCTFANYSCTPQPTATGTWSLSTNRLFLNSNISVDSAGVKTMPFKNAQIQNLGQYSLVLQTGDLQTYYMPTTKRIITRYGFVRVKTQ